MTSTEVDNLVVKLTGEGSDFRAMIDESMRLTTDATRKIEDNAKHIEGFFNKAAGFGEKAKKALETLGIGVGLKHSFESFSEHERTMISLRSSIEFAGRAVKPLMEDYEKFAETMQHATLTTKGQTLSLLEQFETAGFSGQRAKELTADTIGLATASKMEAEHAAILVTAMARGNVEMLRRVPALRGLHSQAQMVAQAEKLMALGMKEAGEFANTTSGKIEHLEHSIGALWKELGAGIATVIRPAVDGLRVVIDWFKKLDPTIRQAGLAIPALLGAMKIIGANASMIFAPILAMLSPMNIVISGMIALGTYLIQKFGGFPAVWKAISDAAGKAWDYIQDRVSAFISFMQPITDALTSFFTTAWEMISSTASATWDAIVDAFTEAKNYIMRVWDSLGIDVPSVMTKIRDSVVTAILFMEYTIKNFGQVWNVIIDEVALAGMKSWEYIRDGFAGVLAFMGGGIKALEAGFAALWEGIKHPSKMSFDAIKQEMDKAFNEGFDQIVKDLGAGNKSPITEMLEKDIAKSKALLESDFAKFKAEKMLGFDAKHLAEATKPMQKEAHAAGIKVGGGFAAAAKKEMEKFDAALSGSAEALFRFSNQKDKFDLNRNKSANERGSGQSASTGPAAARGSTDAVVKQQEANDLLKQIRDQGKNKGTSVILKPSGI